MRPRLALVPGEPAGIGPELCVRLAQRPRDCRLLAIADPDVLRHAAAALALPLRLLPAGAQDGPGALAVLPAPHPAPVAWGRPDPANAASVIAALERGGRGCLDGEFDGLITGPVHKAAVNAAGIAYRGTTELLAAQAGAEVVMMLATVPTARPERSAPADRPEASAPPLRVALATTHLPLRAVPDAITRESLTHSLRTLHAALIGDFGLPAPRIAVLGLNPHAGEEGVLGDEEIRVIAPVVQALRGEGMALSGPLPADSAFLPRRLAQFDAVLAMYHDQGLPVLKHSGFERAVNLTLGLPYPRVAVDHGTALELAGRGLADPSSLIAATELCAELARRRRGNPLSPHAGRGLG